MERMGFQFHWGVGWLVIPGGMREEGGLWI